jgi:hypothetical protein
MIRLERSLSLDYYSLPVGVDEHHGRIVFSRVTYQTPSDNGVNPFNIFPLTVQYSTVLRTDPNVPIA